MFNPNEVLTFYYNDEYGVKKEYKTVPIGGMTESQINALKARTFGEMYDYLQKSQYGINSEDYVDPIPESDPEPIPERDHTLDYLGEEIERLQNDNMRLHAKIEEFNLKMRILKEMLGEAYGH